MWWQDKAPEHTYDWLQASLQRQVKCLIATVVKCYVTLLSARCWQFNWAAEDSAASVSFVSSTAFSEIWFRRNEGVCRRRLILSIKVNQVNTQLTQSRPWLYSNSLSLFDNNTGHSLCLPCQITHLVYLLDSLKKTLRSFAHISINFDVNNSPKDPGRLIIIKKKKKIQVSSRWIELFTSSGKRPRFFQHSVGVYQIIPHNKWSRNLIVTN